MKPPPGGEWEPAAEIPKPRSLRRGISIRHLGVAFATSFSKSTRDDLSQLNRLGLTFFESTRLRKSRRRTTISTCLQSRPGSDESLKSLQLSNSFELKAAS
jgi:hypothetical protein